MPARIKQPLASMKRSKLESVIHEACLGEIDSYIATRYLIDKIPHIEIAAELWERYHIRMDRCTVSRHWERIDKKLR